jgi:hypothetical protein
VKNLFDASPYVATTSDPKLRFLKNITGFGPRDLIVLDSFTMHMEGRSRGRNSASVEGTLICANPNLHELHSRPFALLAVPFVFARRSINVFS